jgi:dipeptidyl aminopeptidase/acylaminoacyl peptidase
VQHWLADQQGVPRLGRGYWQGDSKFKIQYRDPESRKWLKLQNTDWYEEGFSLQAFMADPGFAYAIGPVDGRQTLVRLNVREGQVEEVLFAHETLDIDGLERDGAGRKVIGVTYTEHFTRVHYLAARMRKLQATIDRLLPDTANRITQTLAGGKMFLIRVRSGHRPDEYHILDLNSKQLYLLVRTRPQLDPANMARMEAVTYQARDGMEIPAYITWPKGRGRKNLPAIILPHGGPQSRTTMDFNYLTQFLANRGYLVLQPNFRGSTGYGAAFQAAGEKQWGGLMQDDVTDGTRWLISEGLADPARICIVGASYGGYVALMGAIKTPDLFQCAASINGVADIPGLVAHYKKFIGGSAWIKDLTQDEDGRKAISPQHRAREIKIPVFLAAAKDDETVPYAQSRALYARLKTRVPAVYVQLKRGGNDLDHQDGRQKVLEALDTFLAKHLPVHE